MSSLDCTAEAQASARSKPALVHLALALGGFSIGTSEFAAMSLLPYFSADLGIGEAAASHVISAYALGVVVGAPVLAVMGARMSRRTLLIVLMLAYTVGNILSALAGQLADHGATIPEAAPALAADAEALGDAATIAFLRGQAPGAKWVTSVCTGALVLAFGALVAAGLPLILTLAGLLAIRIVRRHVHL